MYEYKIVQLGVDGSRITLEEIAATPLLTRRELEEFVEDRQSYWAHQASKNAADMSCIKIEKILIPMR